MKKKLALLLVAAMTISSLTACGGSQNDTTKTTETASTAESTESAATEETATAATEDADAELLDTIAPDQIPVEDYVELGDYQNITVTVAPATVSESDIDD